MMTHAMKHLIGEPTQTEDLRAAIEPLEVVA